MLVTCPLSLPAVRNPTVRSWEQLWTLKQGILLLWHTSKQKQALPNLNIGGEGKGCQNKNYTLVCLNVFFQGSILDSELLV